MLMQIKRGMNFELEPGGTIYKLVEIDIEKDLLEFMSLTGDGHAYYVITFELFCKIYGVDTVEVEL